jgi:hypothetical protein
MKPEKQHYKVKDPKLEAPADANRDKHVNYRASEEEGRDVNSHEGQDDYSRERREQWERGLREGREQLENEE